MTTINPMSQGAVHTPGPWECEKDHDEPFTEIGEPIAIVGGEETGEGVRFVIGRTCDFGPHGDRQTAANARLIAAAPDLLAACEAAMRIAILWCPESCSDPLHMEELAVLGALKEKIKTAIEKATNRFCLSEFGRTEKVNTA